MLIRQLNFLNLKICFVNVSFGKEQLCLKMSSKCLNFDQMEDFENLQNFDGKNLVKMLNQGGGVLEQPVAVFESAT